MAGIIKNQILKHLSRFVKDLSSDQINISSLKGEGELNDLELDQETLTELLALPIWMKIKKAHCNRARIMIQWTKLKSTPIRLILDTVSIQVEACEELRPIVTSPSGHVNLPSAGKYGFVNKVVDGITVTVESVEIKFFSKAFESKVQISRIRVESRSPQWKKADLTHTRLKDVEKGEVLTFKEIEWQTLRLEAQSTSDRHLAPLRLLTNQARARVVLKKKISDCNVVGCRLSLILDDLLWVLTDSQILAATHFMSSLSGLVKQATETSQHEKAARKLETLPEYQAQQNQAHSSERLKQSDSARIFDAFDVKETSYHLMCEKIDLHFCDDPGDGRSSHPDLRDGGAAQVQLTQFMIDFYPYHLAKADRRNWPKYSDNELSRWLKQSLINFWTELMAVFCPKSSRGSCNSINSQNIHSDRKLSEPTVEATIGARLSQQVSKLMSTCLILKIRDVCLYKVTTSSREVPLPFVSSYMDRPKDISAVHMEFTWFYYPGGVCFPLPSPKLFTQILPLQLHLDVCTVLWLNSFVTNLQNCCPTPETPDESGYMDIRVEIIMPKVLFEEKASQHPQNDRPQSLQLQAARIILSNFRTSDTGTTEQLAESLAMLEKLGSEKSATSCTRKPMLIPDKFIQHSKGQDVINDGRKVKCTSYQEAIPHLTTDMLWTEPRDVWFINIDPVWADFCQEVKTKNENGLEGRRKFRSSTITSQVESVMHPFIDSVPVQMWVYVEQDKSDVIEKQPIKRKKSIQAILHVDRICNVQLTHSNYLSLMRFVESVSEISIFLTIDTRKTFKLSMLDDSVQIIGCLPRLEISFIMSLIPAIPNILRDDNSIFDLESTFPGPLNSEEDDQRQERTKEWSYREEAKSQFYDSNALESPKFAEVEPQSDPEPHFITHRAPSPAVASIDSIKSSLTQGMKQGISSLAVTFSKGGGSNTPDSEVTSMWSTSDSSENNFVHLDSPENDLLEKENVEVAEEVVEEFSAGSFSMPNQYAKEESPDVNVLTICLSGIRLGQNSEGLKSNVSVSCRALAHRELVSVSMNDFQSNFSLRSKKWKERSKNDGSTKTEGASPPNAINLRFSQSIDENKFKESISSSEMSEAISLQKNTKCPRINLLDRPGPDSPIREAITKSTQPRLEAEIDLQESKDEFITLHASTLKGLAEFVEDEIPPALFPIQVYAIGVNLELIEEKEASVSSSTKICMPDGILVTRDSNGLLTLGCGRADVEKNESRGKESGDEINTKSQLYETKSQNEIQMEDLRQTIIDLQREVTTLKEEKLHLYNELQLEKKEKRIITEG